MNSDFCVTCGLGFSGAFLSEVDCDGCEQPVHRLCTRGYQFIDTVWSDVPVAYIFCKECDGGGPQGREAP